MARVAVVGSPGSGKTTFARRLAERDGVPCVELDALHHLPHWEERPLDDFRALVDTELVGDTWVVDGNYRTKVGDIIWSRADTVVFLDLPRRTCMRRVATRTFRRVLTREELWNGNREELRNALSLDPQRSLLVWTWTRHRTYRAGYRASLNDPQWSHIRFVHLTSQRAVETFLAG